MKTKVDNQNFLDSTIGLILTNLYFTCNSCGHTFHSLVLGIVRRSAAGGKLIVSQRDKADRPFEKCYCPKCGSQELHYTEFL